MAMGAPIGNRYKWGLQMQTFNTQLHCTRPHSGMVPLPLMIDAVTQFERALNILKVTFAYAKWLPVASLKSKNETAVATLLQSYFVSAALRELEIPSCC